MPRRAGDVAFRRCFHLRGGVVEPWRWPIGIRLGSRCVAGLWRFGLNSHSSVA